MKPVYCPRVEILLALELEVLVSIIKSMLGFSLSVSSVTFLKKFDEAALQQFQLTIIIKTN